MITRIRTRSDLLWFVTEHAPSGACRRAVVEGKVVVLGGFRHILPLGQDGWIVRVVSVHDKNWFIAVTIRPTKHNYHIFEIEKIPWADWIGDTLGIPGPCPLLEGDIPLGAKNARRRVQEFKNEMQP